MTGITRFFKPTGEGSTKKAERPGPATRLPFSPLANTGGPAKATSRLVEERDSDVVLLGDETLAGSKRKREESAAGPSAPPGAGATDVLAPSNQAAKEQTAEQQQSQAVTAAAEDKPGTDAAATADVEMSAATTVEEAAPSSTAKPAPSAGCTAGQETAHVPPSAKRQRLPHEPSVASNSPQAQAQQPGNGQGATAPAEQPSASNAQASCSQLSVDGAAAPRGGSTAPATGGAAGGAATGGGVDAKSGGAGPAALPEGMDLGSTVEALRQEQGELEAALELSMADSRAQEEMLLESRLPALAAASEGGRLVLMPSPAELCVWLEGRHAPLGQLVEALLPLLPAGADPGALRTSLVDLAQRKCYSAKEAPMDGAAASEDATPGRLWVWEVREPRKQITDKGARKLTDLHRKRRKELRERLSAVAVAAEALASHAALLAPPVPGAKAPTAAARRSSESRAVKAWNRLSKLGEQEAVEAAFRSALGEVTAGGAAAVAAAAQRETARKAQKEAQKEEKTRQKAEEAKAKEAKRAAEEEAKRRAKKEKEAAKKGFASSEAMRKSQSIMGRFLKIQPSPAAVQAQPGSDAPGAPAAVLQLPVPGGTPTPTPSGAAAGAGAGPAASGGKPGGSPLGLGGRALPAGTPPPGAGVTPRGAGASATMYDFSRVARRVPDPAIVAAFDADEARLPIGPEEVAAAFREAHGRWRQQRATRTSGKGLPPTWARKPSAPTDFATLAAQYYGDLEMSGLRPEQVRTWRRKLLAFPKTESARPPFYGSFSRRSTVVTGRRPFGRDSSLDYDVASDDEWEEEPEGESLSDSGDEADSQAGGPAGEGGEEEDDGFIVGDDHLSEDEGAQLSGDPDDPMDVDAGAAKTPRGAATPAAAAAAAPRRVDPRLQQLEAAIDRVRTNNRPILLVRSTVNGAVLPTAATPGGGAMPPPSPLPAAPAQPGLVCCLRAEPRPGLNTGLDPGLLGALRPVFHRLDAPIAPPTEPDVYAAYALAASGGAVAWRGASGGGAAAAGAEPPSAGPGGAGAAAGAAAGGGSAARAPGSGHRGGAGRPAGQALGEAALTALAEFMAVCGERRMDKVVEQYLAAFPAGTKPPAKTRLREAVPRLGAWSGPGKRWLLHGGSVAGAVAHALAAAEAAGAKAQAEAAAKAAAAAVAAAGAGQGGGAAAGEQLLAPRPSLGAGGMTPTPGPALVSSALTPPPAAPGLPPLPTPATAPGPLLPAPTCTPLDGGNAAPMPTGRQAVPPQQLAAALASLAANPLPSPAPSAALETPAGAGAPAPVLTPASAAVAVPAGMLSAATGQRPGGAATPSASVPRASGDGMTSFCGARPDGAAGKVAAAEAPAEADADAMEVDTSAAAPAVATVELRGALPGGSAAFGPRAAELPDGGCGGGGGPDGAEPRRQRVAAEGGCGLGLELPSAGAPVLTTEQGEGQAAPSTEPRQQPQADVAEGAAFPESNRTAVAGGADGAGASTAAAGGDDEGTGGTGGAALAEAEARQAEVAMPAALTRPMPPPPPPNPELIALGTGHPYWRRVTTWLLGGGGPEVRARGGPTKAEAGQALDVFSSEGLQDRLPAVPLDAVRALLGVCQHRRRSELRSCAFLSLANLCVALQQQQRVKQEVEAQAGQQQRGQDGSKQGPAADPSDGSPAKRQRREEPQPQAEAGPGAAGVETEAAESGTGASTAAPRPPSRCAPQPLTLPALLRLPGLLPALRRGCGAAELGDEEDDPAVRRAAIALAALVAVGVRRLDPTRPFACPIEGEEGPGGEQAGAGGDAPGAGPALEEALQAAAAEAAAAVGPQLAADAAAFRRQVATDRELHAALRSAAPIKTEGDPCAHEGARTARVHLLMALCSLLADPAAAGLVSKPKARLAKEAAAAAEGRPPPPPQGPEVNAKCAARLLLNCEATARGVEHAGCRKFLLGCVLSLLEHPHLLPHLTSNQPAAAASGSGRSVWRALGGRDADPRPQVPGACLRLLAEELRLVAASAEASGSSSAPLPRAALHRLLLALHAGRRALALLGRPEAAPLLRAGGETRTAVADLITAMGEEAVTVLGSCQDPTLQRLCTDVGAAAEALLG